jgi:hypothetical protein
MPKSLRERWLHGLGLSFYAYLLLGLAWGVPVAVGQILTEAQGVPEWLEIILGIFWLTVVVFFCPLAFEWLARKTGLTMGVEDTNVKPLEGPSAGAVPMGAGKKKCAGCGAIVNVYAVRCHECKCVFVEDAPDERIQRR